MTKRSKREESGRDLGMGCSDGVAREGAAEGEAYLEGYGIGCSDLEVIGTFLAYRISSGLPERILFHLDN